MKEYGIERHPFYPVRRLTAERRDYVDRISKSSGNNRYVLAGCIMQLQL